MNITAFLKTIFVTCLLLTISATLSAQTSLSPELIAANDLTPKGIVAEEWSFFLDDENKIYYIDFENINLNLDKIKIVNKSGKAIIDDSVAHLPVNTIYELDCSELSGGEYTIELHSYTEIMRKNITLK
jgi:hypothetical protein